MKKEIEWVFTVNPNNDDLVRSIMEQKLIKVSKVLEKFKADNIVREAKVADYEIRGNQHIAIAINTLQLLSTSMIQKTFTGSISIQM